MKASGIPEHLASSGTPQGSYMDNPLEGLGLLQPEGIIIGSLYIFINTFEQHSTFVAFQYGNKMICRSHFLVVDPGNDEPFAHIRMLSDDACV